MKTVIEYGKAWFSKPIMRWLLGSIFVPLFFPWLILKYINYLKYKSMRKKLAGKVVMITGASSGLGEAFAHVFYKAGCRIILSSRSQSELARVRKELLQMYKTSQTYPPVLLPFDLSEIDCLPSKARDALQIYGHIDILINNGGISYRGNVTNTNVDIDMKVMFVNYFGHIALTKAILPSMIKRKEGHIVVVSSVQGLIGIPNRSAYAASKHALQGFFDCLRSEVGRHNVKVTVISPGYIRTKLSINALTGDGSKYGVMDPSTAGGYDPNEVAEISLRAVLQEKKEVVISTAVPRILIGVRQCFPRLYFAIMDKRARRLESN